MRSAVVAHGPLTSEERGHSCAQGQEGACHHALWETNEARGQSDAVAVQPLSRVQLFVTPWTAARQASLSFTISQSVLKLTSIESMDNSIN